MGGPSKIFAISAVIALGVSNAYYTFEPSLKELKEHRESTGKATPELQARSTQQDQDKEKKVDESKKQ